VAGVAAWRLTHMNSSTDPECEMLSPTPVNGHTDPMGTSLTTVALPVALGVVMFGLGLTLVPGDFARIAKHPKAVLIALVCQVLLLPILCFGLVLAFSLPPILAVGMMLLAASPGGTTANLYSHLFRGDVALNISLTAINSVIAVVTLPLIVNLSLSYFLTADDQITFPVGKAIEVFAIVLVPVAAGMLVRSLRPTFAQAMNKPVRFASVAILVVVIAGAIVSNRELLVQNFGQLSIITAVFCVLSLTIGYSAPRILGVDKSQSVASSFEIGIHNATLAIVIAQTVIGSVEMSLPAAVYGVLMFFLAAAFGFLIRDKSAGRGSESPSTGSSSAAR
jgi:BASS family bile acid:Na+ symporter